MSARTDMTVKREGECEGDLEFTDAERELLSVWEKHWTAPVPVDFAAELVPLSYASQIPQVSTAPETAEHKAGQDATHKGQAVSALPVPIINIPRRSFSWVVSLIVAVMATALALYDHWHFEMQQGKLNSKLVERESQHRNEVKLIEEKLDQLSRRIAVVDSGGAGVAVRLNNLEALYHQLKVCTMIRSSVVVTDEMTIVIRCDPAKEGTKDSTPGASPPGPSAPGNVPAP